ncbi:MAG: PAS domain S-box protein [Melioribacteraceae bacterium]|jgi:PAS domain S-box-containing protein|nr:PAS domain S-box protein [Melioribacteraceae bacterium]
MPKLLLIDDKSDNLTSLAATILSFIPEAIILKSLSGQDGINIAISELPDVILLDVRMPNMDGFEVIEILKSNIKTKTIPVILITANYTDVKSKVKGLESGADSFLTKPIEGNELIAQIRVMLRIKLAEDKLRDEKVNLEILVDERTASLRKEMYIREQKEKSLSESEEFNKRIIESSIDCIKVLDKNGKLKFMSSGGQKLLEIADINLYLNKSWIDFWKGEYNTAARTAVTAAANNGIGYFTGFSPTERGTPKWWSVSVTPIKDSSGNVTSLLALSRDITESKKTEDRLKGLSNIVENATNEIYVFDTSTLKFYYVNKEALKNLGFSKDELYQLTPLDIKPEFTRDSFFLALKPLLSGEKDTIGFETIHRRKDGSTYFADVNIQLANFEGVKSFVAIIRDITVRKRVELERNVNNVITQGMTNTSNLDELLKLIHESLKKVIYGENFFVALHDPNTKLFSFPYFVDKFDSKPEPLAMHKSCTAYIFKSGKPLLLTQELFDALVEQNEVELVGTNSPSWVGIPLQTPEKTIGVLVLQHYDEENIYSELDVEFLYSVGDRIALAIERKQSEEKLRETNEFNESLINTIPFGFDIVDMDGNVLFINNLLKDAIGIENPNGKCWKFYKDNGKQCTECPLKINLELGETNICEVHNVLGGREYEVTHTVMNFKNKKALLEIFRDITEERIAEKKIIQLSRGLEQSPEMVIITDLDGNIEFANPRVTEITGYLLEEIIGKNARVLQSGNTPNNVYEDLWETILSGNVWKGELLNKRKNGGTYWVAASISPIIDKRGNIINFIAIKEDITEKIKSLNELMEAKETAEQSERMKTEFLSQMSHEIRTPLNIISSYSSLLKEEFLDSGDEDTEDSFNSIDLATKRIIRTVDLILNMSEIKTGSFSLIPSNVDIVSSVINPIIKDYQLLAAEKELTFSFDNHIDNPILQCDEYCVNEIFANLIDNAIKYTPTGKVTASLFYNKQNKLTFEVADTGIGISTEFQKNLFIPFGQEEHGYSRKFDGNGLGLSLVKEYCKLNNANVEFESEKNIGSTFRVIFNERGLL